MSTISTILGFPNVRHPHIFLQPDARSFAHGPVACPSTWTSLACAAPGTTFRLGSAEGYNELTMTLHLDPQNVGIGMVLELLQKRACCGKFIYPLRRVKVCLCCGCWPG